MKSHTNLLCINNRTYILRCVFTTEDNFELCISDGSAAYFGRSCLNDIKSKSVEISQHTQLLKQALMTLDKNNSFAFGATHLNNKNASRQQQMDDTGGGDVLLFSIKSVLEHGEYTAGQIPLTRAKDSGAVHVSLFMDLWEQNEKLKRVNQSLELKAKQRDEFMQLSQQAIQQREELERQLYSGFMHVMNSKKVHIRQKHDEIKELKNENEKLKKELEESHEREKNLRRSLSSSSNSQSRSSQAASSSRSHSSMRSTSASSIAFPMETPMKRRNAKVLESNSAADILDDLIMEEEDDFSGLI